VPEPLESPSVIKKHEELNETRRYRQCTELTYDNIGRCVPLSSCFHAHAVLTGSSVILHCPPQACQVSAYNILCTDMYSLSNWTTSSVHHALG
jgi:hypothetical protein